MDITRVAPLQYNKVYTPANVSERIGNVRLKEAVGQLDSKDVAEYLHNSGWKEIPSSRDDVKIFHIQCRFVPNRQYKLALPLFSHSSDYKESMLAVMNIIALAIQKNVTMVVFGIFGDLIKSPRVINMGL